MKKLAIALAFLPLSATVMAQTTDGDLDASSSGQVLVSLGVGDLVRVTFPNGDLVIPYTNDEVANETVTAEFCIYTNQGSPSLDIDVTPQNTPAVAGSPVLESGLGDEIPYSLALELQGGTSISAAADDIDETGLSLSGHTTANNTSEDCSAGGNSHQFVVTTTEAAIEAVPAGSYSDTIQVVVSPTI